MTKQRMTAIDLFCGAGGLTQGLRSAGFSVVAAVDNDELAIETHRANHPRTRRYLKDIGSLDPVSMLHDLRLNAGELDLLAGCPPCQGFSSIRTRNGKLHVDDPGNELVHEFLRFAKEMQPRALMMENVPALMGDVRMETVRQGLRALGYKLTDDLLDTVNYGVPQRRRRYILLGLLDATPTFAEPAKRRKSVRGAIGRLPAPADSADPLHHIAERRSERMRAFIADVPHDGGSRTDLPPDRQLDCHRDHTGHRDVYGRMAWSRPAPTITGGCINPSRGRFLHPDQDRAITLREAALLQSFPPTYKFSLRRGKYAAAQMIGNALPPRFIERQARALAEQLGTLHGS